MGTLWGKSCTSDLFTDNACEIYKFSAYPLRSVFMPKGSWTCMMANGESNDFVPQTMSPDSFPFSILAFSICAV